MTGAPYPSYKSSEVEWLGDIPTHWVPIRLATLFNEVAEAGADDLPILSVSIHDGVSDKELDPDEMDRKVTRSDDRSKYKRVMPGDLVYNMMRAWQGGFGTVQTEGMVSPAYVVARPRKLVSTMFVEHLLRTRNAVEEMRRHSRGVTDFRLRLYWDEFKNIKIPLPPFEEQSAIIAFLDHETARIDALVAAQKRLIELLKEERQVFISAAVTRGFNPVVTTTDSGIEWLGQVPEHWQVKRLKYLCKVQTGGRDTADACDDGEYPFFVRSQSVERINTYSFDGEAVLTAGDGAGVGKVFHHYSGKLDFHQRVYLFSDFREISGSYFFEYLRSMFHKVALEGGAKSTVDSLRMPLISNFWITVPPQDEQADILERIATHVETVDRLAAQAEAAISLLKERRSALISAAVTGKIDVSGISSWPSERPVDRDVVRSALASAIILRFAHRQNFGRVKLQKFLYLAETHAEVEEIAGSYDREAAGPLDRAMLSEIEAALHRAGTVAIEQTDGRGGQVTYKVLRYENQDCDILTAMLGDRKRRLDHLLDEMGDLDTKPVEAVTTLFAVWNDFLIDGRMPTDDAIVSGVLNEWHAEKRKKFTADDLKTWLGWMRRRGIVPHGHGPRTSTGRLFV